MAEEKDALEAQTAVSHVEITDLDELLGVKADMVVVPSTEEKRTVFADNKANLEFLDSEEEEDEDGNKKPSPTVKDILDSDLTRSEEEEDIEGKTPSNAGRPKLVKDAMVQAVSKLVERGVLQPFTNEEGELDKPLEEYTQQDFEELIEANIQEKITETATSAPVELFQSLPQEVQQVVELALRGETNFKQVFSQLAKVQETLELNVEEEADQEAIVRQWLSATGIDDQEELEDEINVLKDRGDLKRYAEKYKPKLDAKQAEIMQQRIEKQKEDEARKEKAAQKYSQTVIETLQGKDLNGIPLNQKVQTMLYHGLTDTSRYQDHKGNPTNALGFLLEQYQFGEKKNLNLVAEALWLLADPDNYRKSVQTIGEKNAHASTIRKLKTEEASRLTSSVAESGERGSANRNVVRGVQRPKKSIFSK